MAFTTVNPAPGVDQFNDFYGSHNNNANFGINSMVQAGNAVTFYNLLGGTFGTINLPLSPNVILSGLVASSIGFALTTTAGTYQVANVVYSIGVGGFTIGAAHPTLNRIDVLVVNNLGAYVYLTGVPAVNAVAPAITLNQLAVTYINIPAAGVPNIGNSTCCIPDGTIQGQTIRWNNTTLLYEISNDIVSTNNLLFMRGGNQVDIGTYGIGTRGYFFCDDNNSKIGCEITLGNFEEILVTQLGVDFVPSGVVESRFNMGLLGGIILPNNTPAVTTNALYNVAGTLWFNGNELCIAPCAGGLPIGTVDFSTLRYDLGALDWVENVFNIAKDDEYNMICNSAAGFVSLGVANKATGILFSQWTGSYLLQSRASIIIACQNNITINHVPSATDYGGNKITTSKGSSISYHANYLGLTSIEESDDCQITDLVAVVAGFGGKTFIKGSQDCTITDSIDTSSIQSSLICNITNSTKCVQIGSFFVNIGASAISQTIICGSYTARNSYITSLNDSSNTCVLVGCENSDIDSGVRCGTYSVNGGHIKSYTGIVAIKCVNSFVMGGVDNTLDPNGLANNLSVFIIGGSTNHVYGGTGNAQNSGLINCTNSDITPTGSGSRITVIGLNGFSATRSNTTHIDCLQHEGGKVGRTTEQNNASVTLDQSHYAVGFVILSSSVVCTLPAIPVDGTEYHIENPDGSCTALFSVTIDGNGNLINGAATQIMIAAYFSVTLRFYGATGLWIMK